MYNSVLHVGVKIKRLRGMKLKPKYLTPLAECSDAFYKRPNQNYA